MGAPSYPSCVHDFRNSWCMCCRGTKSQTRGITRPHAPSWHGLSHLWTHPYLGDASIKLWRWDRLFPSATVSPNGDTHHASMSTSSAPSSSTIEPAAPSQDHRTPDLPAAPVAPSSSSSFPPSSCVPASSSAASSSSSVTSSSSSAPPILENGVDSTLPTANGPTQPPIRECQKIMMHRNEIKALRFSEVCLWPSRV